MRRRTFRVVVMGNKAEEKAGTSAPAQTTTHGHSDVETNDVDISNHPSTSKTSGSKEDNVVELAPLASSQDVEKQAESDLQRTSSHGSSLPMSRARTIGMVTVSEPTGTNVCPRV